MVRAALLPSLMALGMATAQAQSSDALRWWQHTALVDEKGPPSPPTDGMTRTPDGYIWMGSTTGLLRFDGVRFTVLDSTSTPELAQVPGELIPIGVDASGRMWIVSAAEGLLSYQDGRFQVEMQTGAPLLVTADHRGQLWGLRDGGLVRRDGGRWVVAPYTIPDTRVIGIEPDTGRGLWIGTSTRGVWHLAGDSLSQLGTGRLRVLLHASDGAVWTIGADGPYAGLWRFQDGVGKEIRSPSGGTVVARTAVEGPDGSVWIPAKWSGLFRWRGGTLDQYSRPQGLTGSAVNWVTVTADETVWMVTDAGVERLRRAAFVLLDSRNGLPYETPWSFAIDARGEIWSARPDGTIFRHRGGPIDNSAGPIVSSSFRLPEPAHFMGPSREGVWLQPNSGGLVHYLPGKPIQRYGREQGLPKQGIIFGMEARDGTVWVRAYDGEFGHLRQGRYHPVPLPERASTSTAAEDGSGRLWIPSAESHRIFVIAGDTLQQVIALPGVPQEIPALATGAGDTMWAVGTRAIIRLTGARGVELPLPRLSRVLALARAAVVSRGFLWITGHTGVARVSVRQLNAMADGGVSPAGPDIFDGLDGFRIARTAGFAYPIQVTPDGRVVMSMVTGFAFSRDLPRLPDSSPPVVHIEEIAVGGRPAGLADGGALPPNPEKVAIHFTATGRGLPERMRIEYRLTGADRDWIASTPPRVATYDHLRPGRYQFEVRAWDEAGLASARTARLRFRVIPSWYESIWFLALCGLAVACLGGAVVHFINARRSRSRATAVKARYEAVLAERTRLARELHDTLLQGFTGLTLQIDGVRAALADENEQQSAALAAILERADRTLRDAREMVWDMRQASTDAHDLGTALREEGEALANPAGVELEYVVLGAPRTLQPTVVTTILRIAREAIANALNHARARRIVVRLAYQTQSVELEVQDDGCGADMMAVETASARGHWGVAGMRERARSVGGTLSLNAIPGGGTCLGVQIAAPAELAQAPPA